MSILSQKKLLALLTLLACSTSPMAHAERIRGSRRLKSSKGGNSPSQGPTSSSASGESSPVETLSVVIPSTRKSHSVGSFDEDCPTEANQLDNCVQGNKFACRQCLVGVSNMNTATDSAFRACIKSQFSGGLCRGCTTEAQAYYDCGTQDTAVTVVDESTSGNTGNDSGSTSSGTDADPNNVVLPEQPVVTDSMYGPAEACPIVENDEMESGTDCSVPDGFQHLKCYYKGLTCTCNGEEAAPKFVCNPSVHS